MNCVIVIGEGEKDVALMLYNGEQVGAVDGPQMDIAIFLRGKTGQVDSWL